MKRREFIGLAYGAAAAWQLILQAKAGDRGDLPLVGLLSLSTPSTFHDGLAQGLRDLGYVEGQSIYVERRFGRGKPEWLPALAKELVELQPTVIVAGGSPSTLAIHQATSTIPIVMVGVVGPPWAVPVQSLARPGGHITGTVNMNPELSAKRLQILQEMIPSARRVSVLFDVGDAVSRELLTQTRSAAQTLGLTLNVLDMRSDADLQSALTVLLRESPDPVVVLPTSLFLARRQQLADFFLKRRIPSVFGFRDHVEAGGLISYSASLYAQFYRAAAYVDKILKGASPADLPIEEPTKFELVINLRTANALGVTIPPTLLARADEVIE